MGHSSGMQITAVILGRNEAPRLPRAIASLKGVADTLVYIDTGSEDASIEVVKELWHDAVVYKRPWVNFGHNRTEAFELAALVRPGIGPHYVLVLDADQTFHGQLPHAMNGPAYSAVLKHGGISYDKVQIMRSDLPWRYTGVTHEYLERVDGHRDTIEHLTLCHFVEHADSHRRVCGKFEDDVRLLTAEHERDKTNTRTVFYLARSYEDWFKTSHEQTRMGLAYHFYQKRVDMTGGYEDERFYAMLQMGRMTIGTDGLPWLFKAMELRRHRWEPVAEICKRLNERGLYYASYAMSATAKGRGAERYGLFCESAAYEWELDFQHTISSYYMGYFVEAKELSQQLLARDIPTTIRSRLTSNMEFLKGKA